MIYNSFNFLVIFPLLFLLYYVIPAARVKWRNGYLLLVSYLLYMNWTPAYALILLSITGVTYFAANAFENSSKRRKYVILGGGIYNPFTTACV